MTLDEIAERLGQEKDIGSRFPVRIIFTENLDDYTALEKRLRNICGVTLNIAEFCSADDTVPNFEKLAHALKKYPDRQILLLSVGEYLRICSKREMNPERCQFRAFWELQQDKESRTRVIIPLFGCSEIFSRIVPFPDERQEYFLWPLNPKTRPTFHSIDVYSSDFTGIKPEASSLKEWLLKWPDILRRNSRCSVVTRFFGYVETCYGNISTKSYASPFRCLIGTLSDGESLSEDCCSGEFWGELFGRVSESGAENVSLSEIIADVLNMKGFGFMKAAEKWETLNDFQRGCVWLWYRVYSGEDYYSYACRKAENAEEIPARIRDEILTASHITLRWIAERNAAVTALKVSLNEEYFSQLDGVPDAGMRLKFLTYRTHEEKRYAVKTISTILREGADLSAAAEMLGEGYPELAAYMTGKTGCDDEIDRYFAWYRTHKLINSYPGEYGSDISLDRFTSRYSLMCALDDSECGYFWLDGFGAEYAPLLVYELRQRGFVNIDVKIGTALLPTDTEHNHQWDESAPNVLKWNKLDTLAHKGMPDDRSYYSCVVSQLGIFGEAAKKVQELLGKYECVVITGDHGSSRLAALAFHRNANAAYVPRGAAVRDFGRYCELDADPDSVQPLPDTTKLSSGGKTFLVMNGYQHFAVSGNTADGEIHGGNSPEERLVAVITITKNHTHLPALTCTPVEDFASRKKGRTEFTLSFSRKISSLEVSLGRVPAKCSQTPAGNWSVALEGVTANAITVSVIADGLLLPDISLKVKTRGITIHDDPFGEI